MPWAVARLTEEFVRIDCPFFVGIKEANVGRRTHTQSAGVELAEFGPLMRHQGDDFA